MQKENNVKEDNASFSMKVREELADIIPSARHCCLAQLSAFVLSLGRMQGSEDGAHLVIESENETVSRKCFTFLTKTFNIKVVCVRKGSSCVLEMSAGDTDTVLRALKLSGATAGTLGIADSRLLSRDCCRRAFIRGCFLSSGSISAPQKGYHFEIVTSSQDRAQQLRRVMQSCGIEARTVVRKKYHVVYVKEGENIADLLSLMGAVRARMEFENIRILKDVRNSVNRKVNCEAANISKTAAASVEQLRDIQYIIGHYGMESLSDSLKEAAQLRLDNPDASLAELGKMMDPPVSKSGVNHRFKKLKAMAGQIRYNKEDDYDN